MRGRIILYNSFLFLVKVIITGSIIRVAPKDKDTLAVLAFNYGIDRHSDVFVPRCIQFLDLNLPRDIITYSIKNYNKYNIILMYPF